MSETFDYNPGFFAQPFAKDTRFPDLMFTQDYRDAVDWSEHATPVRTQKPCESCTSFALTALIEAHHKRETGQSIELAASWLHEAFIGAQCSEPFDLPRLVSALAQSGRKIPLAHDGGATKPYNPNLIGSIALPRLYPLASHHVVKAMLKACGPVAVTMEVDKLFLHRWTSKEVYTMQEDIAGHHAICLFGYNDRGGYWLAKNSFGAGWGDQGWVRIAYDTCKVGELTAFGIP